MRVCPINCLKHVWLLQTPREYPFDNLQEELGGGFGPQALEERMQASIPHAEEED